MREDTLAETVAERDARLQLMGSFQRDRIGPETAEPVAKSVPVNDLRVRECESIARSLLIQQTKSPTSQNPFIYM